MRPIERAAEILQSYSLQGQKLRYGEVPLLTRMEEKLRQGEEFLFILPAFPAKSPSPEKTQGELPDLGEVVALQNLQKLCDRLAAVNPAGARIVICSDGRVFSDVVNVSDESIDRYNEGITSIISEYNLTSLSVFAMDDLYPGRRPEELREILLTFYAISIEEVRDRVLTDENYKKLFNGIHRFLFEDELALRSQLSRNLIYRETKLKAYELLRRSDAWSCLLNDHFPDTLRLSIHPHPVSHEKFGIKLVPGPGKWATPWHNVIVKKGNAFELMHKKEVQRLSSVLKFEKDKYAYFEVTGF
ncbi:MAG: L-tyrosine/L-tryptophan isonitrile synthase family protein [Bacteriovoracia bacterium]